MARPIRIPQRDVGGGPAVVLPSVGLAAAPAIAGADVGQAVTRAIAGTGIQLAQTGLRAREEAAAETDHLNLVRESASLKERLDASLAGAATELAEYETGPDFTESGYAERRRALVGRAFDAVGAPQHPRLLAAFEGQRQGLLASDVTEDLARVRKVRAGLAIDETVDRFLSLVGSSNIDVIPWTVDLAVEGLADAPPELRPQVELARDRVLNAAFARYVGAGGVVGEIRFNVDAIAGEFDALGEVALKAKAKAPSRFPALAVEMLEQELAEPGYGQPIDNGGLFPTFAVEPDLADLRALREDIAGLPDRERSILEGAIDSVAGLKARRAEVIGDAIEPLFESGVPIHGFGQDAEARAGFDAFFGTQVRPWLDDRSVPLDDKAKLIARTIRGVGFMPTSLASWVEGVVDAGMAGVGDPETIMAVAVGLRSSGFNGVRAEQARASRPGLAGALSGPPAPNLQDLGSDREAFLDRVVALSSSGPARAVDSARAQLEAARGSPRAAGGGGSGRGVLEARFAEPRDGSETELAKQAKSVAEGLAKQFKAHDAEMGDLTPDLLAELRGRAESFKKQIGGQVPEQVANEMAVDRAVSEYIHDNPPVTYLGRTVRDRRLKDALGDYPDELLDLEIEDFFREEGIDFERGDMAGRVRLWKPPGQGLNDNQWNVWVEGKDGQPPRHFDRALTIDPSRSVYQKIQDERRMASAQRMLPRTPAGTTTVPPEPEAVAAKDIPSNEEMLRLFTMDKWLWDRYLTPRGLGGGPVSFNDILRSKKQFEARKDFVLAKDAITNGFIETEGRPLLFRFPKLRAEWNRTMSAQGSPPRATSARGFAEQQANAAVMDLLRQEFKDSSVDEILRAMRTGKLPSED